jgi:hypothetical protein
MTYTVSRLLAKDLCSCDHRGRVELLGKIHHVVRGVLLITCTSTSKEGTEGVDSNGVALRGTPGRILTVSRISNDNLFTSTHSIQVTYTSILPLLG